MGCEQIIELKIEKRVAHIILAKPPDNRMDLEFFTRLKEIVALLKQREDVGAAVIYGSRRHFSAGADLEDIKSSIIEPLNAGVSKDDVMTNESTKNVNIFMEIESFDFPVIAAVNGFCVGSGMELALSADIRISCANAVFGLPEITWGLMTGCSGSIRLSKIVGHSKAKELILTGQMIKGSDAYNLGIVNKVTDKKSLVSEALAMAEKMAVVNRKKINSIIKQRVRCCSSK